MRKPHLTMTSTWVLSQHTCASSSIPGFSRSSSVASGSLVHNSSSLAICAEEMCLARDCVAKKEMLRYMVKEHKRTWSRAPSEIRNQRRKFMQPSHGAIKKRAFYIYVGKAKRSRRDTKLQKGQAINKTATVSERAKRDWGRRYLLLFGRDLDEPRQEPPVLYQRQPLREVPTHVLQRYDAATGTRILPQHQNTGATRGTFQRETSHQTPQTAEVFLAACNANAPNGPTGSVRSLNPATCRTLRPGAPSTQTRHSKTTTESALAGTKPMRNKLRDPQL